MRIAGRTGAVITILSAILLSTTTPALAWFGATHITKNSATQYGGWVDGNGPDTYQAFAVCSSGLTVGDERWAGDRRGSVATCPGGIIPASGSRGFYLNDK
jgi:hypothetical protein